MIRNPLFLFCMSIAAGSFSNAAVNPALLAEHPDLKPKGCQNCIAWNQPQAPFRLHGNSWFVGVTGLSVVVIDTPEGLILLDGGLPESVPLILANLDTLGLDPERVRWILNSHAHYDHAGGIAALARITGARVAAAPLGAKALRLGDVLPEDPQRGLGDFMKFAPVAAEVVEIADGGTVELGGVTVTAHHTPGHTPGGVSWSWDSCVPAGAQDCVKLVFGDSLNAVSAPDFRFSSSGERSARIAEFRQSIATLRGLRCDVLVPAHPNGGDLFARLQASGGPEAAADSRRFVDPKACQAYADGAGMRLQQRLEDEAKPAAARAP